MDKQREMRSIKFRAWDKDAKLYDGSKGTFIVCDCLSSTADTSAFWNVVYGLPLMQYTGLHDKNGKEIYEGDIVKRTMNMRNYAECDGIETEIHEVIIDGIDTLPFCETSTNMDEYEVIGNIYENPELLTDKSEGGK